MSPSRRRSTKRATIKDVAQAAKVSVTTVSNALNGRTEAMTEQTLQRIQAAIRTLNYRPSNVARSLVTNHTATIGVIIAEIDTPLFLKALNVIEPTARSADFNILLCNTAEDLSDEAQTVDLLLENRVDGVIFLSTSTLLKENYPATLSPSAPPMVFINRMAPPDDRFDQVNLDNTNGIIQVVDYLVGLGHRYIAHLQGLVSKQSSEERLQGYRLGLQRHNLDYGDKYVGFSPAGIAPERIEQATTALLDLSPRPTAIIGSTDIIAAVAMRTVQRMGLRVPQDVSIVGVDNQPFCTYLNPALTTVKIPFVEAGQWAIEKLLARIADHQTPTEQILLPCPLIIRESSGEPAQGA